jgi:hypothetical protein
VEPRPALPAREERSAADPGESLVPFDSREKRLVARVLETWRARDAEEPASSLAGPREEPRSAPALYETGTPLRPGIIDGLDPDLCAQLCSQGLLTLEDLAQIDVLALARAVPAGFSRLSRLVSLARRALPAAEPARGPALSVADKFSWSDRPPLPEVDELSIELPDGLKSPPVLVPKNRPARITDTGREGAGGPFA